MISRKELIEGSYGVPYAEIEPLLNHEKFVFVSSFRKAFPDIEINKDNVHFIDSGMRFRPNALINVENNGGWSLTGYHDGSVNIWPFRSGEYYHIGFLDLSGEFYYQGIKEYKDGFFDDGGYFLKPFPTHCIRIEKPKDAVFSTY